MARCVLHRVAQSTHLGCGQLESEPNLQRLNDSGNHEWKGMEAAMKMELDECPLCDGTGRGTPKDCWFCEGTGWHPMCAICDAPVDPGNSWAVNDLCNAHVLTSTMLQREIA